jgi:hypothetical protein
MSFEAVMKTVWQWTITVHEPPSTGPLPVSLAIGTKI